MAGLLYLYGYFSDDRTSELSCHVIVNGVPMIRRLLSDAQELVNSEGGPPTGIGVTVFLTLLATAGSHSRFALL